MSDEPIFKSMMPDEGMGGGNLSDLGSAQAGNPVKPVVKHKDALSPKQLRFCQEYLVDLNQTQAAIRAGYTKKSAQQTSSEIMLKPVIQATIKELMYERAKGVGISAENTMRMIHEIATGDDKVEARLKALEMLCKHTGAYQLDNEQKDNGSSILYRNTR